MSAGALLDAAGAAIVASGDHATAITHLLGAPHDAVWGRS